MTLIELIPLLENMPHDEIRDWIDYVDFWHISKLIASDDRPRYLKSVRNRRTGLIGSLPYDGTLDRDKILLALTTAEQNQAENLLIKLDETGQQTTLAMAKAFHRMKAPIRKTSQGNIQVKWIPYEQVVRDAEGNTVKDEVGRTVKMMVKAPYLYLRYWQALGDNSRKKSRVKSIYIGGHPGGITERKDPEYEYPYRKLAYHFYDLIQEHGIQRKRTIKKTGEIQTYRVRPSGDDNPIAELENKILACIGMNEVDRLGSDAIGHEALSELQASLP